MDGGVYGWLQNIMDKTNTVIREAPFVQRGR